MARKPRKHVPLLLDDVEQYLSFLNYNNVLPEHCSYKRPSIINVFNHRYPRYIHQGKFYVPLLPSYYHRGYKLGQFAKTRKPFFFRSKKKKK